MKPCVHCGSRAIYIKWDDVPGWVLWAVRCDMRCWQTEYYYTKREARKEWKDYKDDR